MTRASSISMVLTFADALCQLQITDLLVCGVALLHLATLRNKQWTQQSCDISDVRWEEAFKR